MAINLPLTIDRGHKTFQDSFPEIVNMDDSMMVLERLYDIRTTDRPDEIFVGKRDIGTLAARNGSAVDEISWGETFKHAITSVDYMGEVLVQRKEWEDMSPEDQGQLRVEMAEATAATMVEYAWNVLNNSFSLSYLGADGVPLCSASHPQYSGGPTYSNYASTALSQSSYEAARAAMLNQKTPAGRRAVNGAPIYLLVSPSNRQTAVQLTTSLMIGTEQSAAGTINMANNPIISDGVRAWDTPHLTDAESWFLSRAPRPGAGLIMSLRRAPTFREEVDARGDVTLNTSVRFGVGWSTPRQLFGSEV